MALMPFSCEGVSGGFGRTSVVRQALGRVLTDPTDLRRGLTTYRPRLRLPRNVLTRKIGPTFTRENSTG